MKKYAVNLFAMLVSFILVLQSITPVQVNATDIGGGSAADSVSITTSIGGEADSINIKDENAIVFTVNINQSSSDRNKILITLPTGIDLISAPGISSVDADGNMNKKDLVGEEGQYFETDYKWDGQRSVDGMPTKSGVLTYNLKAVDGAKLVFQVKVDPAFIPVKKDEFTSKLGEIKAELMSDVDDLVGSDVITVDVTSQERGFDITEFGNKENLGSTALDAFYATSALIGPDRTNVHYLSFKANINKSIPTANHSISILENGFNLTYPKGAIFTPTAGYSIVGDVVDNGNETLTATVVYTKDFPITSTVISSNFGTIDFSGVYNADTPSNTNYKIVVSDLKVVSKTFNPETQKFEEITFSNIGDSDQKQISNNVTLVGNMNSLLYAPSFKYEKTENEKYNDYTGEYQLLYSSMRNLGQSPKDWNNNSDTVDGSAVPIRMEYIAIPEGNSYLDKVTEVSMDVPFLGRAGMDSYTSQLTSVTVWYDSDDLGELGITDETGNALDITDFQTKTLAGMLENSSTSCNTNVDTTGIATYSWKASGGNGIETPSIKFTAPEGKSIVKIRMEFTGDNATIWRNQTSYSNSEVRGIPYDDEYTGTYSKYQFITYQMNEGSWVKKAASTIGGFRWLEPKTFELNYKDTSLINEVYYYNVAKYNTQIPSTSDTYRVEGYQNLGSIAVFNDTGAIPEKDYYVLFEFQKDTTSSDVIKKVKLPMCPIEQEESIVSIEYTYANGSSHIYYADSTSQPPYEIVDGDAILEASGDHKFTNVKVILNSWGRATDQVEFGLYGYLEDTSNLTSDDAHRLSYLLLDKNNVMQERKEDIQGFEVTVNSTFKEHTKAMADLSVYGLTNETVSEDVIKPANVVNAGSAKELSIRLVGGSYNHIENGSWTDITFNLVLPKGVTLTGLNARDFGLEKAGNVVDPSYPTKETVGNITFSATAELTEQEAKAHFGENSGVTGATVYTCTVDDEDVILYGYRNGTKYQTAFSSFKVDATIYVDADTQTVALPWSKVLFLGSNSTAYTQFKKITTGKPADDLIYITGSGMDVANFQSGDKLRLGNTNALVSGSEEQYILIKNEPKLLVNNAHVIYNGEEYHYSSNNPDSLAILGRNDIGSVNFKVTNTILEDDVDIKTNYVVISLPTATTENSLNSAYDFETEINSVNVAGTVLSENNVVEVDGMTITTKFITLNSAPITSGNVIGLFDGGDTIVGDHNAMILKIENQKMFNSFDVSAEFKMPEIVTGETQFVEFKAMSSYCFTGSTSAVYDSEVDGDSYIRFAYENPIYTVDFKGVGVTVAGQILGDVEMPKDPIQVLVNNKVYQEETGNSDDAVITAPPISGYEFKGWYADEDLTKELFGAGNEGVAITSDTTIYAKYEMKQIKVTYVYNDNDNTTNTTITKIVNYTDPIARTNIPEKPLHTFAHWCKDDLLNHPVTESNYGELDTDGDGEVTLYAAYTKNNTYFVTYVVDGVESPNGFIDSTEYEEGNKATIISTIPTKEGYTFNGWDDVKNGKVYRPGTQITIEKEDVILTALWTPTEYTITFKDDEGNKELEDSVHPYKENVELPSLNNKTGYIFIGWKYGDKTITDNTLIMPSNDVELVSVWEKHQYNVNLYGVANGEITDETFKFEQAIYHKIVEYNDTIKLPTPTREGYTFEHWISGTDITDDTASTYLGGADFTVGAAHVDLTAVFKVNSYKVTYAPSVDNESLVDGSDNVIVGNDKNVYKTTIQLPRPIREGHTFDHWVDQDGKKYVAGSDFVIPSQDTVFTATWTPISYVVSLVDEKDHEHVYDTINVTHGTTISITKSSTDGTRITLDEVTKPGHKFEGWKYNGTDMDAETVIEVVQDILIEAVFTIKQYIVEFDVTDKNTFPNITQDYDSEVTIPETEPTNEGHAFIEWVDEHGNIYAPDDTFHMPEGGLTLTPVWNPIQYSVSFRNTGDVTLKTIIEDYGTTIKLPSATKDGYTLAGWSLDDELLSAGSDYTIGAAHVELIALWKPHSYDVIFDHKNDTGIVTESYDHHSEIEFTVPVRDGYTFKGWYLDEDNTYQAGETFEVTTAGLMFTALWQANKYTITFAETGDTTIDPITATFDSIVQFPFPTKKGYEFDGWKSGDKTYHAYEEINMPVGDIDVTGIWTIRSFDVTFDHAYDNILTTEKVEYASSVTFVAPEARVGYTFKGWMLGDKLYNSDSTFEMSDEDVTFVAVWEAIPYKISFKDTGDTQLEDVVVEYDSTYTMPIPVKSGYKFDYWMDEQGNIYRAHEAITMKDGNLVLTAKWTKLDTTTPPAPPTPEPESDPESDPEPTPDPVVTPTPVVKPAPTVRPSVSTEKVDPPVSVEPDDQVEEVIPELPEENLETQTTPEVEYEEAEQTSGVHIDGVCWICKKHTPFIFGICIRCFIIICICIAIILTMIDRKIRKERRKRLERQSQEVS